MSVSTALLFVVISIVNCRSVSTAFLFIASSIVDCMAVSTAFLFVASSFVDCMAVSTALLFVASSIVDCMAVIKLTLRWLASFQDIRIMGPLPTKGKLTQRTKVCLCLTNVQGYIGRVGNFYYTTIIKSCYRYIQCKTVRFLKRIFNSLGSTKYIKNIMICSIIQDENCDICDLRNYGAILILSMAELRSFWFFIIMIIVMIIVIICRYYLDLLPCKIWRSQYKNG